jgi:hypothetical protein
MGPQGWGQNYKSDQFSKIFFCKTVHFCEEKLKAYGKVEQEAFTKIVNVIIPRVEVLSPEQT